MDTEKNTPKTSGVQEIIDVGRRLYARQFVAGADGNISVRQDDHTILITRTGAMKGFLAPNDIVTIGLDGTLVSGSAAPSSEREMHLEVYRSRPEIVACVHSHPPYCTALAVAGKSLPEDILPEVVVFVGEIITTTYAPPGTGAVGKSLHPGLTHANAFILKNHGLLTIGRTLTEAHNRHETVESLARVFYLASALGQVDRLDSKELERLRSLRDW